MQGLFLLNHYSQFQGFLPRKGLFSHGNKNPLCPHADEALYLSCCFRPIKNAALMNHFIFRNLLCSTMALIYIFSIALRSWVGQTFSSRAAVTNAAAAQQSRYDSQAASLSAWSVHFRRLKICNWVRGKSKKKFFPHLPAYSRQSLVSGGEESYWRMSAPLWLGLHCCVLLHLRQKWHSDTVVVDFHARLLNVIVFRKYIHHQIVSLEAGCPTFTSFTSGRLTALLVPLTWSLCSLFR